MFWFWVYLRLTRTDDFMDFTMSPTRCFPCMPMGGNLLSIFECVRYPQKISEPVSMTWSSLMISPPNSNSSVLVRINNINFKKWNNRDGLRRPHISFFDDRECAPSVVNEILVRNRCMRSFRQYLVHEFRVTFVFPFLDYTFHLHGRTIVFTQ